MQVSDVPRTERRREAATRTNRAQIKAYLASVKRDANEIDEPVDAQAMRPYVYGDER